jgi:hypothetical protein
MEKVIFNWGLIISVLCLNSMVGITLACQKLVIDDMTSTGIQPMISTTIPYAIAFNKVF